MNNKATRLQLRLNASLIANALHGKVNLATIVHTRDATVSLLSWYSFWVTRALTYVKRTVHVLLYATIFPVKFPVVFPLFQKKRNEVGFSCWDCFC